jgi:predicted TIM-barrel fold metal-dependent hydrolase
MERRTFLHAMLVGAGAAACRSVARPEPAAAPGAAGPHSPIIDMHLHAYPAADPFPDGLDNPVTGRPPGLKDGEAHLQACLAEMKRYNIVRGVVSGGSGDRLGAATHWLDAAPDRIIAGAGIRGSADTPLPDLAVLRDAFASGRIRVLGEVTAEYAGRSLSDPIYDPYLALAEEFDIPVSLHTGLVPPGQTFDPCCRSTRVALGKPLLVEDALNRHPKLRLNIMHGGYPYLEDMIALLVVYPQVSLDLGAMGWGLPRPEFHAYVEALVRAGFGKRIMFGSDQMYWPDLIGRAIDAVDAMTFLTPDQRHDIFYGNAARFLKLEKA